MLSIRVVFNFLVIVTAQTTLSPTVHPTTNRVPTSLWHYPMDVQSIDWTGDTPQVFDGESSNSEPNCPGSTNYCWHLDSSSTNVRHSTPTTGYNNIQLSYSISSDASRSNRDSCVIDYSVDGSTFTEIVNIGETNSGISETNYNAWGVTADNIPSLTIRLMKSGSGTRLSCYFNEFTLSGTAIVPTARPLQSTLSPTLNPSLSPTVNPTTNIVPLWYYPMDAPSTDWTGDAPQSIAQVFDGDINSEPECPGATNYCWHLDSSATNVRRSAPTTGYNNIQLSYSISSQASWFNRDSCIIDYSVDGSNFIEIANMGETNSGISETNYNAWGVTADNIPSLTIRLMKSGTGTRLSCYFNEFTLSGTAMVPTASPTSKPTSPTNQPSQTRFPTVAPITDDMQLVVNQTVMYELLHFGSMVWSPMIDEAVYKVNIPAQTFTGDNPGFVDHMTISHWLHDPIQFDLDPDRQQIHAFMSNITVLFNNVPFMIEQETLFSGTELCYGVLTPEFYDFAVSFAVDVFSNDVCTFEVNVDNVIVSEGSSELNIDFDDRGCQRRFNWADFDQRPVIQDMLDGVPVYVEEQLQTVVRQMDDFGLWIIDSFSQKMVICSQDFTVATDNAYFAADLILNVTPQTHVVRERGNAVFEDENALLPAVIVWSLVVCILGCVNGLSLMYCVYNKDKRSWFNCIYWISICYLKSREEKDDSSDDETKWSAPSTPDGGIDVSEIESVPPKNESSYVD